MIRSACFAVLILSLAACGGSSSSGQAAPTGRPVSTVSGDGGDRTVAARCAFSQRIAGSRGDGLRIAAVSWLQTAVLDADDADTRLMADKPVRVRVDILADRSVLAPATRELLVHDSVSGRCERIALTGPARVPTATDRESLDGAYTATIPARLVRPDLAVSIVLDDPAGRSLAEADRSYRVLLPDVAAEARELVRIIPLRYRGVDGYVQSPAELAGLLVRLHPLSAVTTRTAAVFSPPALGAGVLSFSRPGEASYATMERVLDEVDDECARLNGAQTSARTSPKCLAVFPDNLVFRPAGDPSGRVVGLAYVGGTTMLTESVAGVDVAAVASPYAASHWLEFRALTVAHEMGHLLDLDHAGCGGARGLDARLYGDGRLGGGAGYDSGRDFYFSSQRRGDDGKPQFADLMSYCSKEWPSDRGYLAAMAYRVPVTRAGAREQAGGGNWLKISPTGRGWKLRQVSFAPATLRPSDFSLRVLSDQGSESLPLTQAVIADAPDGQAPLYVHLGERRVISALLLRAGDLVQDLSTAVLQAP